MVCAFLITSTAYVFSCNMCVELYEKISIPMGYFIFWLIYRPDQNYFITFQGNVLFASNAVPVHMIKTVIH